MVLALQASASLKDVTTRIRMSAPLIDILDSARKLYEALELDRDIKTDGCSYPDMNSSMKGMSISFQWVFEACSCHFI